MEQQLNQAFELNPHQYEQNDVAQTLTDFSEAVRNGNVHTIMSFYEKGIMNLSPDGGNEAQMH